MLDGSNHAAATSYSSLEIKGNAYSTLLSEVTIPILQMGKGGQTMKSDDSLNVVAAETSGQSMGIFFFNRPLTDFLFERIVHVISNTRQDKRHIREDVCRTAQMSEMLHGKGT